jgi:hypothetical protein
LRPWHEMVIDHVVMLVPDAARTATELRGEYGLGCERGPYLAIAGTRGYNVPSNPPAYLEFHTIENREAAEATEAGRIALACEAEGFGLFSWSVLVDDLDAVSDRLGIEIFDYTVEHGDGTLRGLQSVALRTSRSSSTTQTTATDLEGGKRCTTGLDIRPGPLVFRS